MVKTSSLYLTCSWNGTGMWRTDGLSERRTTLSPDKINNILFLHKIGLIFRTDFNKMS